MDYKKKRLNIIKKLFDDEGQSTIEFAIVVASMLIIAVSLSLIWKLGDNGILIDHAIKSASHHIQEAAIGIIGDVFSC